MHSELDDAGLTPTEFRLLGHISRRAGSGECNASVPNMARHCGVHANTARKAVKGLVARNLIHRLDRQGQTALFTINHGSDSWKPAPQQKNVAPQKEIGVDSNKVEGNPHKEPQTKVIPLKVIPSKDSPAAAGDDSKSPFRLFTDGWMERHQKHFGEPYLFTKAKDGSAVARLIKSGTAPEELLALAEKAWQRPDGFNCKAAASIAGFAARFNEIRAELRGPARKTPALITPDFSKGF